MCKALTSRRERDFLILSRSDLGFGKGAALTADDVATLVKKVSGEAVSRAKEVVDAYLARKKAWSSRSGGGAPAPAAEGEAKEEGGNEEEAAKKEQDGEDADADAGAGAADADAEAGAAAEVKQAKKPKGEFTQVLEPSYPLFVVVNDLVDSAETARALAAGAVIAAPAEGDADEPGDQANDGEADGEAKEEAPAAEPVRVELTLALRVGIEPDSKEDGGDAAVSADAVDLVESLQRDQNCFGDMIVSAVTTAQANAKNGKKTAKDVVEACQAVAKDAAAYEAWRAKARPQAMSAARGAYVSADGKSNNWDAVPDEKSQTAASAPSSDMSLYNARLAKVPAACATVPVILHCLVEQVAANCVGPSKARELQNADGVKGLYSYLDDALSGLGGAPDAPAAGDAGIVVPAADALAVRAAASLQEERAGVDGERLVNVDAETGLPGHALSGVERALLRDRWPLAVLGGRAFPAAPALSEAERGTMRTELLSGDKEGATTAPELLQRALQCRDFQGLVRTVENAWRSADPDEVGKRRQEWSLDGRVYREDLGPDALNQTVQRASRSLGGAVRTAWRYSARDDTLLAVCHAHTPILRKRVAQESAFLFPVGLARCRFPAGIHRTAPPPKALYPVSDAFTTVETKKAIFFPADQSRMGQITTAFGGGQTRLLFVENNSAALTMSTRGEATARFADASSLLVLRDGGEAPPTLVTTTPAGLRVQMCGRTNYVYQSRPSRASVATDSIATDSIVSSAELWRCVLDSGAVAVRRSNGSTQVYMPDGRTLLRSGDDGWEVTDNEGGVGPIGGAPTRKIEALTQRDVQSKASVATREDGTMFVRYSNGATLAQFADGTRIFSEDAKEAKGRRRVAVECPGFAAVTILRLKPPKTALLSAIAGVASSVQSLQASFSAADGDAKEAAEGTKPSSAAATAPPKKTHRVSVLVPGVAEIDRLESGSFLFRQTATGDRAVVDRQGRTVLVPSSPKPSPLPRELKAGVITRQLLPPEVYLVDTRTGEISTVDREENTFRVSLDGEARSRLSRDIGPGAVESDEAGAGEELSIPAKFYPPPANARPPRLFCVRRDGSGFELLDTVAVQDAVKYAKQSGNAYVEVPREDAADDEAKRGAATDADPNALEDDDADIEIEEDAPAEATEKGAPNPARDVQILTQLAVSAGGTAGGYAIANPPIPNVVRAGARRIAVEAELSGGGGDGASGYGVAQSSNLQEPDVPLVDGEPPVQVFRVMERQDPLEERVLALADRSLAAFRRRVAEKKRIGDSMLEAADARRRLDNQDAQRVQLAVVAARRRNHARSGSGGPPAAAQVEGGAAAPEGKLHRNAKYLKDPRVKEPPRFFEKNAGDAPLKKAKIRLEMKGARGDKFEPATFSKYFLHPANREFFELQKALRAIFTQRPPGAAPAVSPKRNVKKPKPDPTVDARWLPEKDLAAGVVAMEGFVKCLARPIGNPSDPTLRTVSLKSPPYSDVLQGSSRLAERAPGLLSLLGFVDEDGVYTLPASGLKRVEKNLDEMSFFVLKVSQRIDAAARERKKAAPQPRSRGGSRGGSRLGSRLGSRQRPQAPPNSTMSRFDVVGGEDEPEFNEDQMREFDVQSEGSQDVVQFLGTGEYKQKLKYRPVHWTVANERRKKSLARREATPSEGTRSAYLDREAPARRRLQTSSTFKRNLIAGNDGMFTKFVIRPREIAFGDLRAGNLYGFVVNVDNKGDQTGRYLAQQPRNKRGQRNLLRIVHKPGPIPSGLTSRIEVQLWAGEAGEFRSEIHIQTETDDHVIPVSAFIGTRGRELSRTRSSNPGHVRLVSRKAPADFLRFLAAAPARSDAKARATREVDDDDIPEPKLPDFTTGFGERSRSGEGGGAGPDDGKARGAGSSNYAGPIPDADEASAARANKALEKQMLESMKKM